MILSLELEEHSYGVNFVYIKIDLINKNIHCIKNGSLLEDRVLNYNIQKFIDVINSYIIHWDNEYSNDKIIDGKITALKIHTDTGVINYTFKNEFPYNYNDFMEFIKSEVGFYE